MIREFASILLLSSTGLCWAQQPTTPTIVKSDGVEMQAIKAEPAPDMVIAAPSATGEFDTPPSHPDCAKAEGQACLDRTSSLILTKLKTSMGVPSQDLATHGNKVVSISFGINQFGDMKDIRVQEQVGDKDLYQKIMVALYDLPKFTPAMKDGATTGATMHINYTYADLFAK
ncbi:MAG: hypothetical protein IPH21_16100 [Flavobacteriales bacterium]|nr:hypothetical protein [Flavobacteriales bacterium]